MYCIPMQVWILRVEGYPFIVYLTYVDLDIEVEGRGSHELTWLVYEGQPGCMKEGNLEILYWCSTTS